MLTGRRAVFAGLVGGITSTAMLGTAHACPAPRYEFIAPDQLPPAPTIFIGTFDLFRSDEWGELRAWSAVAEPPNLDQWHVEAATVRAFDRASSYLPVTVTPIVIGGDVLLAVTLHATSGEVAIRADDSEQGDGTDDGVVFRRINPSARRPWTQVTLRPNPFYGAYDGLLVERDEPVVDVEITGDGVGFWTITTTRCVDHLVRSPVTSVPTRCLDPQRRLIVSAHAFDGSIERVTVQGSVRPVRPRSRVLVGALGLAGVSVAALAIWLVHRRRRTTPVIVGH